MIGGGLGTYKCILPKSHRSMSWLRPTSPNHRPIQHYTFGSFLCKNDKLENSTIRWYNGLERPLIAYTKGFNFWSHFPSSLSLPHYHISQKKIFKIKHKKERNNNNKKPILKGRQARSQRKEEFIKIKIDQKWEGSMHGIKESHKSCL